MAVWRRKALELFPELRGDLNPTRSTHEYPYNYHSLFFDLFDMFREALEAADEATLRRVTVFAEWCLRQDRRAPDLANAAGVAFYEHVFDVARIDWPDAARWLSPEVVRECWSLWEFRHDKADIERIREILSRAGKMPSP